MKKVIGCVAALAILNIALACLADPVKEPAYSSEKPLYAKLVMDEKATEVLTLAFDESEGTGKGYDTIYADLNLNGDLTDEKAIKGLLQRYGRSLIDCPFRPIVIDVHYNEKAKGVKEPWQLVFNYHESTRRRLFGLIQGKTYRSFFLYGKMKLKDDRGEEWVYSFSTPLEPAKSLAETTPIAFRGKPTFQIETKPDPRKKGNTGIAAHLRLGTNTFTCFNADQAVKAQIRVTSEEGKAIHSEDVGLDKLAFG